MPRFGERPQEAKVIHGEALGNDALEITKRLERYKNDAMELLSDSPTLRNQAEILARSEDDEKELLEAARIIVGNGDYAPEALAKAALILREQRKTIH